MSQICQSFQREPERNSKDHFFQNLARNKNKLKRKIRIRKNTPPPLTENWTLIFYYFIIKKRTFKMQSDDHLLHRPFMTFLQNSWVDSCEKKDAVLNLAGYTDISKNRSFALKYLLFRGGCR